MCVEVFTVVAPPPAVWQLVQLVALVNKLWSGLAPTQVVVDLWQLSHTVWPLWIAVAGLPVAPKLVLAWQVAHCVLSETLLCTEAGLQLVVPPLWQLSQLVMETPLKLLYGMWLAPTALAGGKPPLWQLAHWLATGICVWFHFVGFQPVTLWQLMQFTLVGMWVAALPTAALPLWQLVQLVALVNKLWSGLAPTQVVVDLWQVLQAAWVGTCPDGLPTVMEPLWQLAQALEATPLWSNLAPAKVTAEWQLSQPNWV